MLWKLGLRQLLFRLSPERAHHLSMGVFHYFGIPPVIKFFRIWNSVRDPRLQVKLFGLTFQNPVGLAAGFDKEARWYHQLPALGFSHIEVGTLTGQAQPGNPQPRLFRLPSDQAIINRMGFNNSGSDAAAERLATIPRSDQRDILGINIGKTKIVPLEDAAEDYLYSFERLFEFADYVTVNVSSPNTPGLRQLQNRDNLLELLNAIVQRNHELATETGIDRKPILLKIAPDVSDEQLADIVSILQEIRLDGIIATNTTLSRDELQTPQSEINSIGNGGLSGKPLTRRSREIVEKLFTQLGPEIPIIGVGGIMNGEHAWDMICAGASLVQIYTGFIYGGPSIVRQINQTLQKKLSEHQLDHISQAVGLKHKIA